MANLFELPAGLATEEVFELLLSTPTLRIERIISSGQTTPPGQWYDQDWDEWVILLQGEAVLGYADGSTQHLRPGDYLLLPAHCRHRVEATSQNPACIWLAIHGPGAEGS
jgi:cupin 2 domain-containing protein